MRRDDSAAEDMLLTNIFNNLCSEFAESTILTIAHRLRTVIDYDRVSVLTIFFLKLQMAKNKIINMVGDDT